MQIYNLFPLTIMQDKINLEDKERNVLISEIEEMFNKEKKN